MIHADSEENVLGTSLYRETGTSRVLVFFER